MATQSLPQNPTARNGQHNYQWIEAKITGFRRCKAQYPRLADAFQREIEHFENWLAELTGKDAPLFLKEVEQQAQAVAAAELRIFYCENRLARACPNRQTYWQKQLAAAWRRLAYWQRKAGER